MLPLLRHSQPRQLTFWLHGSDLAPLFLLPAGDCWRSSHKGRVVMFRLRRRRQCLSELKTTYDFRIWTYQRRRSPPTSPTSVPLEFPNFRSFRIPPFPYAPKCRTIQSIQTSSFRRGSGQRHFPCYIRPSLYLGVPYSSPCRHDRPPSVYRPNASAKRSHLGHHWIVLGQI